MLSPGKYERNIFMDELNNNFSSDNGTDNTSASVSEPTVNTADETAGNTAYISPENGSEDHNEVTASEDPFREESFRDEGTVPAFGSSVPPYTGYPAPGAVPPPPPQYTASQQVPPPPQYAASQQVPPPPQYAASQQVPPPPQYAASQQVSPPPQYAAQSVQPPPVPAGAPQGYGAAVPYPVKPKEKKLSVWGTIGIVVIIAALFMTIMVILAVSAGKQDTADKPSDVVSSEKEPVNKEDAVPADKIILPVKPKPVQETKYYQDEDTGLLTVAGVAKTVLPSVVDVEIFGETTFYPDSRASGIIISDDGYIITNAHVVSSVGAGIKVKVNDGREFEAELIGKDTKTDLAVIKIEGNDLTPAELGDSDQLEVGEQVAAIGNSGGYSGTLTVGYISGLKREVKVSSSGGGSGATAECIQTDAALSPGVSGGALVNMYGQVIGITTLKYQASELDEGLGFAISMKFAKPIIEDIISQGYISGRVRIGIYYTIVNSEAAEYYGVSRGILVSEISEECDISNTELKPGDIITEINGVEVYSAETIETALEGAEPGDKMTAHVFRKGITEESNMEFDIEFKAMQDKDLS